jgi:hypothetical protein
MSADTARFLSSAAFVLCIGGLIFLAAFGCRDFEAYVATICLAIMAAFIGSTQDA